VRASTPLRTTVGNARVRTHFHKLALDEALREPIMSYDLFDSAESEVTGECHL
jgi:hypothetical protein